MEVLDVKALFASEQQSVSPSLADLTIDVGNLLVFNYQEQPSGLSFGATDLITKKEWRKSKSKPNFAFRTCSKKCSTFLPLKVMWGHWQPYLPLRPAHQGRNPYQPLNLRRNGKNLQRRRGLNAKNVTQRYQNNEGFVNFNLITFEVFDPVSNDFKPRWGKNRVLDPVADNWVAEDKPELLQKYGASDPFELATKGKKERVEKQNKRELANKKRASQKSSSIPLNLELHHAPRREVSAIQNALQQTQRSTASMGHFDKLHSDEPKIKRKPKFMPARVEDEKALSMKIANRILRDTPEIDTTKATNLAIQKEQRESSGKRPTKRRRQ
eukprot:TRINITY_DN1219_c0_g1_i8.p1 TRINITY_DN1219_c0_g1~~TRINITY_DN1219_c0_g1_i8.p1  ORF type:complete len:326 (+),score=61.67 TRINITY_DN1219_c0_g1_i8:76-1053(+)